ncbi:hypothetical protein SAMN05444166_1765 [Singulisphaera sp. GP187]|nr:hypothetical protein SAMN05444166_1765 [Singulisphaera sp. GP187]
MRGRAQPTGIVGPTTTPRPIAPKKRKSGSARFYAAEERRTHQEMRGDQDRGGIENDHQQDFDVGVDRKWGDQGKKRRVNLKPGMTESAILAKGETSFSVATWPVVHKSCCITTGIAARAERRFRSEIESSTFSRNHY